MASVDVILPSYNSIATINKALASVAMQVLDEGDSFRVTVVDDCSTDGVEYERITDYWNAFMPCYLIPKAINEGCGQARQTGMNETDGDFIMFLDTDDSLVTPHAIRYLLRAIQDQDIVMGQFVEETETGSIMHGQNYTWCHAKMYRRSFLERHLIRFNRTRYNEDSGFNQLARHLTDRVKYIPQILYSWNNNKGSTVRTDKDGYRGGYGWRDFIENLTYACEELQKRNINKGVIRDFAVECAATLYYQYSDAYSLVPEEDDLNRKKLQDFYKRALRPYVLDGAVIYEHLTSEFMKHQKDFLLVSIPQITFREYIRMLGFFDDMKRLCK
jgi:glycosyltransferase involved in cell wall biosynthesis